MCVCVCVFFPPAHPRQIDFLAAASVGFCGPLITPLGLVRPHTTAELTDRDVEAM